MKDMAIARLMEKDKCAAKADKYVDYVFESCRSDTAPFTAGKQRKAKTMTDVL